MIPPEFEADLTYLQDSAFEIARTLIQIKALINLSDLSASTYRVWRSRAMLRQ